MIGKWNVTFGIEPIVKLLCYSTDCKYHLKDQFCCNLKHIFINEVGECKFYDTKKFPMQGKDDEEITST